MQRLLNAMGATIAEKGNEQATCLDPTPLSGRFSPNELLLVSRSAGNVRDVILVVQPPEGRRHSKAALTGGFFLG
jgi:hypothetical protein